MKVLKSLKDNTQLTVLIIVGILVTVILAIIMGDSLYSVQNLTSIAYKIPEFALLAMGMSLAFMTGGIDLSIIANANTSGIFAAFVLTGAWFSGLSSGASIFAAILVAITSAVLFGLINGLIVGKTSAHPMIVTLANMIFISGIGMAITGGNSVVGFPTAFTNIGTAKFLGVPVIFIFFVVTTLVFGYILSSTSFGRKIYLYGDNKNAARFSGIDIDKMGIKIFMITGLFAGLSSIIIISRVNSAKVGYGDAYLLKALLVSMIGGINPEGGKGKLSGVIITIFIIQLLSSAFTYWELSPYSKKLIWGSMLIIIMFLNDMYEKYLRRRQLQETVAKHKKEANN